MGKGKLTSIEKTKLADAGISALVAGLRGAKAVLDTTSIPGASAVFSVVDAPTHHHRLALQCMQIITQSPYGKVLESEMTSKAYLDQEEYPEDVPSDFPEELRYALRNVFVHIIKSQKDVTLKNGLDVFSRQGLLWWLEYRMPLNLQLQDIIATYTWRVRRFTRHSILARYLDLVFIRSKKEMLRTKLSF